MLQGSFENLESIFTVSFETLFSSCPVDDLPDVLHICSFAIVVLNNEISQPRFQLEDHGGMKLTCR